MEDCAFPEKVWLVVLDKGFLALIVIVAGFFLNRVLELLKDRLARQQDFSRTANQAVVDLTRKLAAGSHLISWLSWSATEPEPLVHDEDFAAYDKDMIAVLSELVGLQAAVAALSPARFRVLSEFAEELYERDVEVGRARDLFRSRDRDKIGRSFEILRQAYAASLAFDRKLLEKVTGLLQPAA